MISESYLLIISKNTRFKSRNYDEFFSISKEIYDSFINTHRGFGHLNKEYFFFKEGFLGLCFSREMNTCYTFDFDLKS